MSVGHGADAKPSDPEAVQPESADVRDSAMFGANMASLALGHADLLAASTRPDLMTTYTAMFVALAYEVCRLREAIAELETKLARVQELAANPVTFPNAMASDPKVVLPADLEAALKG